MNNAEELARENEALRARLSRLSQARLRATAVSSAHPCVRASLLPERSRRLGPEPLYPRGPLTVITNSLDSFLPSLVPMAPSAPQSPIPATGPLGCRCGTSGNARSPRAR